MQIRNVMHTWLIVLKVNCVQFSEEDEDDVSSSHSSISTRPRGDTGRVGVPVLPVNEGPPRPKGDSGRVGVPVFPVNEVPPPPPRHLSSQGSFGGGIGGGGSGGGVARGLPPLPQVQLPPIPISAPSLQQQQQQQPPRPPPVRSRPMSTSGVPYGRADSGQLTQFGPGRQEREVRLLC